jgi:signal transduction histidine kinase
LAAYAASVYPRLQAREAAIQARDEFLGVAAHELRTPLTSLKLLVQALRRTLRTESREKLVERAHQVERHLQRLERLVEQLLDVSRVSQGKLNLHPEALDLSDLLREVASRFEVDAARSLTEFRFAMQPAPGRWDRLWLEQVVSNLLQNALKYGGGKPVDLAVRVNNTQTELSVSDHGIGIAPEQAERIFEKFERAVSQHEYGGMGLGLYIARQVVEQMGGTLEVSSRPGEGATFLLSLPRASGGHISSEQDL